jgi:hypothetical protein
MRWMPWSGAFTFCRAMIGSREAQRRSAVHALLAVVAAALMLAGIAVQGHAADLPDWATFVEPPADTSHLNYVFVFGGRMSTSNFGSTLVYNTFPVFTGALTPPNYDNYIVGGAYQRDFYRYGGIVIAGEVGIADRFGHYAECCSTIVMSSSMLNSGEFWFGPNFRYDAIVLFNRLRVVPGMTFGFSLTTNSIGAEREREITEHGDARFLGYLGPEVAFSLVSAPQWELVLRMQHRSGADRTFGHLMEGYNANVAGLRYRF